MKLTVKPDKGFASKEIFFTKKNNALYCICPVYPNQTLTVQDLQLSPKANITLLGRSENLKWKQVGKNIQISVPLLTPSNAPCNYAYTFKIDGI
jgi:alpha-L-fucosidase